MPVSRISEVSDSIQLRLPDGTELELPAGATGAEAAAQIGPGLARAALAVKVDGELRDLGRPLPEDGGDLEIVTADSPESLELIRHDAAHVLAEAVLDLWPEAKISIGPPIADGFYYDIEFPDGNAPGEDDLAKIEEKMAEHISADEPFERSELDCASAIEHFGEQDQDYKVELIEDLRAGGEDRVSIYRNGGFEDLCRGPHAPSTGRIGAFKLTSLAGAYWRGDETRQMLTRIYGTAFHKKADLEEHLELLEQARERDHRRLGPELDLFMMRPEAPGIPFWLPEGTVLLALVEDQVREQLSSRGYREIKTPQILDEELWHRSGHFENYRENMFFTSSEGSEEGDRRFALKPMNCPGACLVFGSTRHSYRELPLRLAEFGLVSRDEREGVLHGLLRVRAFVQDDAHVFCTPEQIGAEVTDICEAIDTLYSRFGFDQVEVELSTRPEKSIGADEQWEQAEAALAGALDSMGREYRVNPGDGAFYGPKIDFHITDALGRSWQCGTCQLDFSMPERFDLHYTGADNSEHRPVLIHRALLGSLERFVGILIEHYGGRFPLWLAPVQVGVLPVADRHLDYAADVAGRLDGAGFRARIDGRSESVGKKVRDAELAKLPFMLVVGDEEAEQGEVSVRSHDEGDLGKMSVDDLIEHLGSRVER